MNIHSLKDHLEIFNQTFSNALTRESPISDQPSHMKTPLMIHQLSAIHAMRDKEINLRRGYRIPSSAETVFSQYAFLGDRVGVGKTFMTLGHISQMALEPLRTQTPLSNLNPHSTSAFFSISPQIHSVNLYDSLVVVPHTLYRQWQDTIKTHTTLKVLFLKTQKDLDKDDIITNLSTSHMTLISNTLLPMFMNSLKAREIVEPTWRRVFYDEADTIKISSTCTSPAAIMTWYITASYRNLILACKYYHTFLLQRLPEAYIDSLHPELRDTIQIQLASHPNITFYKTQSYGFFEDRIKSAHPLRGHLIIMNSEEFLNESVNLPPLNREIIRCQAPITQQMVESVIPSEAEAMLHAGDVQGALQFLGINSHTSLTIVEATTAYKTKELDRMIRLLAFKKEEEYATPQAKDAAIKALEEKIRVIKEQIESIRRRTEEASKDGCSICFDSPTDPVITPCCSKIFCATCILQWMQRLPTCPLCREKFHPSQLCAIARSPRIIQANILPKKIDALLNIIKTNPDGRFLIFSRYENPLIFLQENMSMDYKVARLNGNKDVIAHTLAEFKSGSIRVLLLDSRNAAAGLNIPSATHVILLHKMLHEEEKQILGRAYRLGREGPLNFIKLLHERE